MNDKRDALLFVLVASGFALITYLLLLTSSAPTHFALDCFAGSINSLPFGKIEQGMFLASGTLFLYPPLLQPLLMYSYKACPPVIRIIPRKFVSAANFRVLVFGLMFSAFFGTFVSAGVYSHQHLGASIINKELVVGLLSGLTGLFFISMQDHFRQIRSTLKKRGPFEALLYVLMLLIGVLMVGHAFMN